MQATSLLLPHPPLSSSHPHHPRHHAHPHPHLQLHLHLHCHHRISIRHFTKHLKPLQTHLTFKPKTPPLSLNCSLSTTTSSSSAPPPLPNPLLLLASPTPLDVCKLSAILSLALFVAKSTLRLLFNPFFWTYFSFSWLFWPWLLALSLAALGLYSLHRHSLGRASLPEQLALVTSVITWLTLVPPAHFNGYLEGWPLAFFFAYHYFFFFEASVRHRLYGDLHPRPHDLCWDVRLPSPVRLTFAASVIAAHWFAAAEGPPLHLTPGDWANWGIWALIAAAQFIRYHSVLYLAKYSEKIVVPNTVVQFGPYRWVRHPIYASNMLLFLAFCTALRAPLSLLFGVGACIAYYDQKSRLEERLMVETFGDMYTAYKSKVPYKFIPFVY